MEAILASPYVTIGELVRLTGARYSTLKYYTEEGFLPFEQADTHLTRRYPRQETVERIERIRELRGRGKTISQIRELLEAERIAKDPSVKGYNDLDELFADLKK